MGRVVLFEPWYGGSHRAFADAWRERSVHRIEICGLAARHWQWRMEASAWEFARIVLRDGIERPDALVVSDYVDLPRLLGSLPSDWRSLPTLAYFHENQLTYPSTSERSSASYGFTNVLTAIAADALVFNSAFHRDDFEQAAQRYLARLPKPTPQRDMARALEASHVVAPCPELARISIGPGAPSNDPLRVVFPHRLEPDKDPIAFLRAVERATHASGQRIDLVLVGGDPGNARPEIRAALAAHADVILSSGVRESRGDYLGLLRTCDVVASTAQHEFFGVAAAEAMAAGCTPLVPDRLAYPEVHGRSARAMLYRTEDELVSGLASLARDPSTARDSDQREENRRAILEHDASRAAPALDRVIEELMTRGATRGTPPG